jgi:uncharacterized surface protein with fasciclin (FAS1) repeats
MNKILKNIKQLTTVALAVTVLAACNKGIENIPAPAPSEGQNIAQLLNADANYSIFQTALVKYNLLPRLSNTQGQFTLLALDNPTLTTVLASLGLTPASFAALPAGQPSALAPVFNYHVIPQNMPVARFASSYTAATALYPANVPNTVVPSSLNIGAASGLPVQMNVTLGTNGANSFANNIPIAATNVMVGTNGVLHRMSTAVMPPSQFLGGPGSLLAAQTDLEILRAALVRADSGQVGAASLSNAVTLAPANLTIFAPTDNAFKGLISFLTGGLIPLTAPNSVFINFINTTLTATQVRGIVSYHILGNRTFSVNLPLANRNISTLLNSAVPAHPGILVDRTNPTPRLLGAANGAGNFSNFTAVDLHAINGVIHKIDRVLLPQ